MNQAEKKFVTTVREHYQTKGRHDLPWRHTSNPYHIHISEIMLQQTQVGRVQEKYALFLQRWGSVGSLASASLGEILTLWQGLGYNRRAQNLHRAAQALVTEQESVYPTSYEGLLALPGIGPYTAGAIMAFAYNQPVAIIETNIRTVYLHHFFRGQEQVSEKDLHHYIERTLDRDNPREWYWALMDYGAYLKLTEGNLNRKAKSYTKQSKFKGSDREVRGAILRTLCNRSLTKSVLKKHLNAFAVEKMQEQLDALIAEGMIVRRSALYCLPD